MFKYEKPYNFGLKAWAWFQLLFTNLLMYFMLVNIAELNVANITLYASFLFISIFAYTSLMDRHPVAVLGEITKVVVGGYILYQTGGWFGLEKWIPAASIVMGTYIAISLCITIYYSFFDLKVDEAQYSQA